MEEEKEGRMEEGTDINKENGEHKMMEGMESGGRSEKERTVGKRQEDAPG